MIINSDINTNINIIRFVTRPSRLETPPVRKPSQLGSPRRRQTFFLLHVSYYCCYFCCCFFISHFIVIFSSQLYSPDARRTCSMHCRSASTAPRLSNHSAISTALILETRAQRPSRDQHYVCIYIYIYIDMYKYTNTYRCICMHMHMCTSCIYSLSLSLSLYTHTHVFDSCVYSI